MIHSNLFISNFKKVIAIVLTFGVLVATCHTLDYLFVREDDFGRIVWHSFYNQDKNIDNLFVGSSHVYCDINPFVLGDINGQNNFNLSVGNMRLNSAYYAIREANKYNDLSNVVLELYYDTLIGDMGNYHSVTTVPNAWISLDYMKNSINKVEFLWTLSEKEQYIDSIFRFTRFREHLFDTDYIANTVQTKQSEDYKNYKYKIEDELGTVEFLDNGYGYTTRVLQENQRLYRSLNTISADNLITEDAKCYLRKIIEYCKAENIQITLTVSPIYELQTIAAGDYDLYYNQIAQIAGEYSVPFYDFNLCKEEYLDIQHSEYFMDTGHLNATGANIYTKVLWSILSEDNSQNSQKFYNSFEEKKQAEEAQTFGLSCYANGSNLALFVISNRYGASNYTVSATTTNGDSREILRNDSSNYFEVPADEHGILSIQVVQNETNESQCMDIEY